MAVTSTQIVIGATGATALVAPTAPTGPEYSYSTVSSAGLRYVTLQVGATGAFIGGSASTSATGATNGGIQMAANTTLGPIPLRPTEGLYGIGTASSTVSVLVTGA